MAGRMKLRRGSGGISVKSSTVVAGIRWMSFAAISILLYSYIHRPCGMLSMPEESSEEHRRAFEVPRLQNYFKNNDGGQRTWTEAGGWRKARLTKMAEAIIAQDKELWEQPETGGWRPCLQPSAAYQKEAKEVVNAEIYIVAVVTGGLNQMRRQIGAAVVIARVLKASLVVPVLSVNAIWKDRSEFADLFDVPHFQHTLSGDVHVVTSLPVAHLRMQRAVERQPRLFSTPEWLRENLYPRLRKDHVMILRGLDSTLADDLPRDLQRLRCKVEFAALRFATPLQSLGLELARRLWSRGPFVALHLRLEKDVWVRTGCLPGLTPELDEGVVRERRQRPEYLTARSNLTFGQRQEAGLCPLSAQMVVRILTALGANNKTRIFWAGGEPYGGDLALAPLHEAFKEVHTKTTVATPEELAPFEHHGNMMAALDFIVALESDIFMPSHGGNMAHVLQGHRAFFGHRKFILPNKRKLIKYLLDPNIPRGEFVAFVKDAHKDAFGPPQYRTARKGRDVVGYPVPECMCQHGNRSASS